ncbi:hypothetical protein NGRA_0484 [Nosema granulosis]|uniref:Uncharacterized protein n=1 Tax=Nosema granulosis TaxID=83296 RepID=A0A9P6H0U0_9MICR|nr:hypothetical protein NGRA_0484 [Nosema granulosis]
MILRDYKKLESENFFIVSPVRIKSIYVTDQQSKIYKNAFTFKNVDVTRIKIREKNSIFFEIPSDHKIYFVQGNNARFPNVKDSEYLKVVIDTVKPYKFCLPYFLKKNFGDSKEMFSSQIYEENVIEINTKSYNCIVLNY